MKEWIIDEQYSMAEFLFLSQFQVRIMGGDLDNTHSRELLVRDNSKSIFWFQLIALTYYRHFTFSYTNHLKVTLAKT